MKLRINAALVSAATVALCAAANAQFSGGNLAVSRVGNGSAALTNASTAVFIDQYTPAGVLVNSLAMPTSANGAQLPLTASGTATSELALNLSGNGLYLVLTGYDTPPGTSGVASSSSASIPRLIGLVNIATGATDTSTQCGGTYFSGNNIRSAWSPDGSNFWAVGANTGVVYEGLGGVNGAVVSSNSLNNRVIQGVGSDIWFMTGSAGGGSHGLYDIPGHPTTGPVSATNFLADPSTSSPYDWIVLDATDIYVADDGNATGDTAGGIQKWTYSGGTWNLDYVGLPAAGVFVRSLATDGTNIYAITTDNHIVVTQDTGTGFASFTDIASAPTNTSFRGIKFIPATLQQVDPTSYAVTSGMQISGSLSSLFNVDQTYVYVKPTLAVIGNAQHHNLSAPVQVVVTATSPSMTPASLAIKLVGHVTAANLDQAIELYNYSSGHWDLVDTRVATTTDQSVQITASSPAQYVNSLTGQVQARISYYPYGRVLSPDWTAGIDQVVWEITP